MKVTVVDTVPQGCDMELNPSAKTKKTDKPYEAIWLRLCREHTREDGVRCCFTMKCPLAKEYGCYSYRNFDEFMSHNFSGRKQIKSKLTKIAKERNWSNEE